ncbi:hypothetical protein CVS30_13610 [Arthrobacter psychrolactophilus]|uniref:SURF1-like protein n=1 Tax=Arthrobacter psychrolactophilus TaxID=92442 RepID=A0A2V5IML8_9MICC|nr:SURF1 family protein [Arthrobacter psychrolactophilus]PYI37835.1 hypothetical protein CVS30_13610 [Arthrobacter psychrolactophilus]
MLKTAIKPKWIAALVFALAVSVILVLLSHWQLSRSLEKDVAPPSVTEKVQPLLNTMTPGHLMTGDREGQVVTAQGHFDPSKQLLLPSRLEDGNEGYWDVVAFVVDGAVAPIGVKTSEDVLIPVARGWVSSPDDVPAVPEGKLEIEGRLLNSEGPVLKKDLPEGQISALSTADLTNRWNSSMYAAFIVSFSETVDGHDVGAAAADNPLVPITVTATDQNNKINWLNIFYSIEWAVFAGFAIFIWWRLVADDYRREQDALYDLEHPEDDETP